VEEVDTVMLIRRAHAETAFDLAQKMNMDGSEIHIVFSGKGTHYLSREETLRQLSFADLYSFETEFDSPINEIRAINYFEFVELLEKCERTFTWI
jgi:hypothetical protein